MGITILKIFIWGGISLDIRSEITVLKLRLRVTVKPNFSPCIRRYTSSNENFEYSYPLNDLPWTEIYTSNCLLKGKYNIREV